MAKDTVSGASYEQVKLVYGEYQTNATPVSDTNPIPVKLSSEVGTLQVQTTSGSVTNATISGTSIPSTVSNATPYDMTATGTILTVDLRGYQSARIEVSGTFTGVITPQGADDSGFAITGNINVQTTYRTGANTTSITIIGVYEIVGGLFTRFFCTTAGTGTVTVKVLPSLIPIVQNLNIQAVGPAAVGVSATSNPLRCGGVARTVQPTARADGQIVDPLYDKVGRYVIKYGQIRDLVTLNTQTVLTDTTETTISAAIASTFNDLQWLSVDSTAVFTGLPVGVRIDFRDSVGGTVRFSVAINPSTSVSNGVSVVRSFMGSEMKQATVNTAWTAKLVYVGGTAPAIGTGDIRITAQTVQNV